MLNEAPGVLISYLCVFEVTDGGLLTEQRWRTVEQAQSDPVQPADPGPAET